MHRHLTSEFTAEIDRLQHERQALIDASMNHLEEFSTWRLQVGKFELASSIKSQMLAKVFAGWHTATFTLGTVLTFFSATRELGIALVVGSLFAIGGFLSQWWSQTVDKERYYMQQVYLDDELAKQRVMWAKIRALDVEIEEKSSNLPQKNGQDGHIDSRS